MAFSPDNSTLATTASDGTIRLWDTRTRRLRAALTGAEADSSIHFSPTGRALTTITTLGTARLWSTDVEYVATRVCRLSRLHHWSTLLPHQPVQDLCP
ncbi:WD40 repeat domain-containing protein [Streptomyces sp. NPDC018019]|uniref:WD40 repeat domain-containing protein n=1 Tax=Streptomyces sp. NPDC018019 TaxID=3365030 RepID=UPI0037B83E8F